MPLLSLYYLSAVLAPEIPEDLYMLIKKAVAVRKVSRRPYVGDARVCVWAHDRFDRIARVMMMMVRHMTMASRKHTLCLLYAPPQRRPTAPGAQPQGQGLQVPPHPHRVPHPPPGPLLPHHAQADAQLEVRVLHRRLPRRLSQKARQGKASPRPLQKGEGFVGPPRALHACA